MLHRERYRQYPIILIILLGFVVLYVQIHNLGTVPIDWISAFRSGARGDTSLVVTPYWVLLLSYLPAHLPEPWGYAVWMAVGSVLLFFASETFRAPLWPVLISYQFNWVLFYGQVDFYLVFGIAVGYWAWQRKRAALLGLAIALLLIKPQVGVLAAIFFLWRSPDRQRTLLTAGTVALISLIAWPGWPARLILEQWFSFLYKSQNTGTNTSLQAPLWISTGIAIVALIAPLEDRRKLLALVAANLLASPYSTIYSQVALLSLGLPAPLYMFGILPWIVAIQMGPLNHWGWAALFPATVFVYSLAPLIENFFNGIRPKFRNQAG